MSEYRVNGLDIFSRHFAEFSGNDIIVGGTACYLTMRQVGLEFRATKDIDMIITVEELSHEFGVAFWQFIVDGGYSIYQKDGQSKFYRFTHPTNSAYPKMIELFSRKQDMFTGNVTFTPIVIDDEISSLSAILLDDDYYSFLKDGKELINGISVLKPTHLIAFKARAYGDLKKRKSEGQNIDESDLKKHKNDVFRLIQLLTGEERIFADETIKNDIKNFLSLVEREEINLSQLGLSFTKEDALTILRNVFEL